MNHSAQKFFSVALVNFSVAILLVVDQRYIVGYRDFNFSLAS